MPSPALSRRQRLMPVDHWAGVAPQFERIDGGWLFRRHRHGPAIRVTADERDAFAAAGRRALLLHALTFCVCSGATWLLVSRLFDGALVTAIAFAVVVSLLAMALYGSQQWYADAPARALADRPAEAPARAPDHRERQSYTTIVATVAALLFLAALGTGQPLEVYVGLATGAVMLGLFMVVRRWRYDSRLSPTERRRADAALQEREAREKAAAGGSQSGWQVALLLFFVMLELAVLAVAVILTVGIAMTVTGSTPDTMGFGLFMISFVAGLMLGVAANWPVDRLCKHWTGASAANAFDWIPAGW